MDNLEKLENISLPSQTDWREKAQWRKDNRDWLRQSGRIAVAILEAIDATPGMSQKVLAEKLNVSQQYISKVVKGSENLSLQTICKLESALGIALIEVPGSKSSVNIEPIGLLNANWSISPVVEKQTICAHLHYSTSEKVA